MAVRRYESITGELCAITYEGTEAEKAAFLMHLFESVPLTRLVQTIFSDDAVHLALQVIANPLELIPLFMLIDEIQNHERCQREGMQYVGIDALRGMLHHIGRKQSEYSKVIGRLLYPCEKCYGRGIIVTNHHVHDEYIATDCSKCGELGYDKSKFDQPNHDDEII